MKRTSEWVSAGHPDKTADYISSYILDDYLREDPKTRFALEVMVKNNTVILGGEITSTVNRSEDDYKRLVKEALDNIGYIKEYSKKWGEHAIEQDKLEVKTIISKQSPNIAQGVDNDGWGDQGIFYGYAHASAIDDNFSPDYYIAKSLGQYLYKNAVEKNIGGLDIKTQVTMEEIDENASKSVKYLTQYQYDKLNANGGTEPETFYIITEGKPLKISNVVVAIPVLNNEEYELVKEEVADFFKANYRVVNFPITINGTGIYQTHSSIGDCGITGRKLVVDFYGSGCNVGGGTAFGKEPHKADLSLNLYARYMALKFLQELKYLNDEITEVKVQLSCCIGKDDVTIDIKGYDKNEYLVNKESKVLKLPPSKVIKMLDLEKPIYAELCKNGLFTKVDEQFKNSLKDDTRPDI
jgi:S-adenosylmethionine synthetase